MERSDLPPGDAAMFVELSSIRSARKRAAIKRKHGTDSVSATAVAAALLPYLQERLGVAGLDYSALPSPLHAGWETHLYRFRLKALNLPSAWDRPLMLRIHVDRRGWSRARHEFEVPRYLARLDYPVPEPLLVDEVEGLFSGPFLILE